MVIYNSGDSELLIQALTENLKSSREIIDRINRGTQQLNSAIAWGTLSGAAYRAGQSLFQNYISPMIQKLASAISDIQADLDSYKRAEQQVRGISPHLDEDLLIQKLDNTYRLIQLVEQKIEEDKQLFQKFMSSGFEGVATALSELPGLDSQLYTLKNLKHDYDKQLQALQVFSSSSNALFIDSLQAFKYALQGVEAINHSSVSVDGTIIFPTGIDMSWSTKLQGLTFDAKLQKNEKKRQKESVNTQQFVHDVQDIKGFLNNSAKNLSDWANFSSLLKKYYALLPKWMRKINENTMYYEKTFKETDTAHIYKIAGDFGCFEIGKAKSKSTIMSASKSFKSGETWQYKKANPGGLTVGPTIGKSHSLFIWTLPKVLGGDPIIDVGSGKYDAHFRSTKEGFDVGSGVMVAAATFVYTANFDIPGTNWQITIGTSRYVGGLGASGHVTADPKDGNYSFGANTSLGIGGGFNFGVSKKKKR